MGDYALLLEKVILFDLLFKILNVNVIYIKISQLGKVGRSIHSLHDNFSEGRGRLRGLSPLVFLILGYSVG